MSIFRSPRSIAVASACALLLAACGGSDDGAAQVATLSTGDVAAATDTTVAVDTQEALLAYAQCMRDNGVDMQDPTVDADGNVQGGFGPESGIDPRSDEFQTAQEACGDLMEGVSLGGGPGGGRFDQTAIQDGLDEFTECLRDEGLDVDDVSLPEPGDGPPGGGAAPGGGQATGDTMPAGASTGSGDAGFDGGPPGSPPEGGAPGDGGPGGEGFDPTARIIEQLGLDDSDPEVSAAIESCSAVLTEAFTPTTDTTEAG